MMEQAVSSSLLWIMFSQISGDTLTLQSLSIYLWRDEAAAATDGWSDHQRCLDQRECLTLSPLMWIKALWQK
ncbi:hypothetical protein CRENBAI_021770 [Crenichthys baileyi]|uniref:Secreted protein n=1 Tax=Crenichthys baileyi TaxID=28760 RepID=A0AAV9SPC5_9TELE